MYFSFIFFFLKSTDGIFSTISVRNSISRNTFKNRRQRIRQNVANATDIFNDPFSHFRFMEMYTPHPTSEKYSRLNSATFCLSNKSDDRIITLTREKIDLYVTCNGINVEWTVLVGYSSNLSPSIRRRERKDIRNTYKYIYIYVEMENNFHLNLAGYRVIIRLKPTKPILFVSPMGQLEKFDSRRFLARTWYSNFQLSRRLFVRFRTHTSPSVYRQLRTANVRTKLEQIGRVITIRHGNIPSTTTHRKG